MALLLCGFGGFIFSTIAKGLFRKKLNPLLKLWLAMVASFAISAALFAPKSPRDLVVYGLAGTGLAVVIHRGARLLQLGGDVAIRLVIYLRAPRR